MPTFAANLQMTCVIQEKWHIYIYGQKVLYIKGIVRISASIFFYACLYGILSF